MGIAYNTSIVRNGLVLHLDAANSKSYPGTGTAWNDLSGRGNNGTLINGPTYDSLNNGAILFDGVNDYVAFNNPLNQANLSQVWTVTSWINITDKTNQPLLSGLNSNIFVCYAQGNNSLLYLNAGANDYYTYGGDLGNLGWVMATFRFDNSTGARTIYRNTTNISTSGPNFTSIPSGQQTVFQLGNGLQGKVSQLLMYNRYISDLEITQNFEALRGRYSI